MRKSFLIQVSVTGLHSVIGSTWGSVERVCFRADEVQPFTAKVIDETLKL